MRDIQLTEKTTVKIYESIKELPIKQAKRMQAYLIRAAGIGQTIDDVDEHLGRLFHFLSEKKAAEALEETKNLRYNLFIALNEMDFKTPALLCLVHSINGEPIGDYSDGNLARLAEVLGDVPTGKLDEVLEDVKKNLTWSAAVISRDFSPTI